MKKEKNIRKAVLNELEKYEKELKNQKIDKKAIKKVFLNIFKTFSKIDEIDKNFLEIYKESAKFFLLIKNYLYPYQIDKITEFSFSSLEFEKVINNEIEKVNLAIYKGQGTFFKEYQNLDEVENFLFKSTIDYLNYAKNLVFDKKGDFNEFRTIFYVFIKTLISYLLFSQNPDLLKKTENREKKENKKENNDVCVNIDINDLDIDKSIV